MAFGVKYVQSAEKDKLEATQKHIASQEQTPEEENAPQVSRPSQVASSSSSGASRFRRQAQGSSVVASTTSGSAPKPSRFARSPHRETVSEKNVVDKKPSTQFSQPAPHTPPLSQRPSFQQPQVKPSSSVPSVNPVEQSSSVSQKPTTKSKIKLSYSGDEAERVAKQGPTPFQQKGLRARRLVQEVGDFQKWDAVTLEQVEREALRDPDTILAQYSKIYLNEVKPFKVSSLRSLEEAIRKHPQDVVFLLMKKGGKKICILPSSEAGSQDILQGATLESVSSSLTKFVPPSELFAPQENNDEQVSSPVSPPKP